MVSAGVPTETAHGAQHPARMHPRQPAGSCNDRTVRPPRRRTARISCISCIACISRLDPAFPWRSRLRTRRIRVHRGRPAAGRGGPGAAHRAGRRTAGHPARRNAAGRPHWLPAAARLHRHPHPPCADRCHRLGWKHAARLAGTAHVPGRTPVRRRRTCALHLGVLPRRARAQRHHDGAGVRHRAPDIDRRTVRGGERAQPAAGRRQGDDGLQLSGRPARHRAIGLR